MKTELIVNQSNIPIYKINKSRKMLDIASGKLEITVKILPSNIYYPPSCTGFDICYFKQ